MYYTIQNVRWVDPLLDGPTTYRREWQEADGSEELKIECGGENWERPISNSG